MMRRNQSMSDKHQPNYTAQLNDIGYSADAEKASGECVSTIF